MPDSTNSSSESEASKTPDGGESREASKAPDGGESHEAPKSQLEQVAALLREPEPGAKADGDGKSEKLGESKDDSQPKTINEFAERHGVDVKDLYDLQFNFGDGDGESCTLAELKNIAVKSSQLEVDRLAFDETKTRRETDFVRAQAELQEIVTMLPKAAITPELLQILATKRAGIVKREAELTLSAIPEWSDNDTETTDRTSMREHLAAYGFAGNYLDSVTDHKTLKYIRDNMQRQQRIERVLAQVKQVNKAGHKPSAKPTKPAAASKRPTKTRSIESQVQEVAELLKVS